MALTCIKWTRRALAGAALACCVASALAAATQADLLAAREAAHKLNWRALESLKPRFAGDVLEAYPAYWLLAGAIDRADAAEVRAFLARYPDSPLADSLRREWLKALGAAGAWDAFRAEHPKLSGEDAEITCFAFQERLARADPEVAGEARALFVSGRDAPVACDAVFAALAGADRISDRDIWDRIRKSLAAGSVKDAKRALMLLAPKHRIPDKALDRAAADPAGHLAREKTQVFTRIHRELALFAVTRLARSRPEEAAERLAQVESRLGRDSAREAWAQVAWQAAMAHHPRSLEWYERARGAELSDSQLAWRVRAALRAANWKEVLAGIQALPPELAREATWRYWRARALRALGSAEAAQQLFRGVAAEPGFYGLLAAEEAGVSPTPDWNGWHPQPADLERVRALPGIQRALLLYAAGLDNEAFREWVWAIRGLDDRGLLAAAEVARIANEPDRAINTADKTVELHDLGQRYPVPHRDALAASARQWSLDEAMVYSIIRQESRFMPEARSRVGATGLMQLMPATAKWVARQIPVQNYRPEMLVQPEVNIHMGTYYLHRVLAELGHPLLAAAAYNAGPGRARRWRDERALEGAIYAETIPFNETRDYVKKVFANAWFYRHRLSGKAASLREMLGSVPGRAGDASASVASILP